MIAIKNIPLITRFAIVIKSAIRIVVSISSIIYIMTDKSMPPDELKNRLNNMMTKKASAGSMVPPPPLPPTKDIQEILPRPRVASLDYSGDRKMSLDSVPPRVQTNALNGNQVAVDTGKNLSGNQVKALAEDDIEASHNRTIFYIFSCFNCLNR